MRSVALLAILSALSVVSIVPPAASAVVWDYTLTYAIDDSTQTASYSLSGIFASHPECAAWAVSSPVTTTIGDMTHQQRYRVSLVAGTIEQVVQENGITVLLNPEYAPDYYEYQTDCTHAMYFITPDSNPTRNAVPGRPHPQSSTQEDLSKRSNVCVSAKVGTTEAPLPFTGRVWTNHQGYVPSGPQQGWHKVKEICSPLMLGGVPIGRYPDIGLPVSCPTIDATPTAVIANHVWEVEPQGLDGLEDQILGVGSYGGTWKGGSWTP